LRQTTASEKTRFYGGFFEKGKLAMKEVIEGSAASTDLRITVPLKAHPGSNRFYPKL